MLELLGDPPSDVASSVAEVPTDTEARWTVASVSPGVDGGNWDVEELGEVLGGEQLFKIVHRPIVRDNPFTSLSIRYQQAPISAVSPGQRRV